MTRSLSGSLFIITLDDEMTNSSTVTFTDQNQNDLTNTTSKYGTIHIVGPPCNWTGSVCSPSYAGPPEFDVYQDNIYGTFMFWPVD